jgi:hypothetical protein
MRTVTAAVDQLLENLLAGEGREMKSQPHPLG